MEENNVNGTVTTNVSSNYGGSVSIDTNLGSNTTGNDYTTDNNKTENSTIIDTNSTTSKYTTTMNATNNYASGVPAKVSVWSKIKQFLCQEITVELTPRQERAFKEVYDFWHQDITVAGTKEFWLQDIEITL